MRENLRFFAGILGAPQDRVDAAIATVQLGDFEHRVVRDMSGGQRARVSLATALLGDPDVMILDEPTVGLDPVLREDLWATFNSLAADGKTLLVSSHVMDEAVALRPPRADAGGAAARRLAAGASCSSGPALRT